MNLIFEIKLTSVYKKTLFVFETGDASKWFANNVNYVKT